MKNLYLSIILLAICSTAFALPVRVFYKVDGTVAVVHPVESERMEGENDTDFLNRASQPLSSMPDFINATFEDMDSSELPQDRTYRNAWVKKNGKGIKIDQVKKEEIDADIANKTKKDK